MPLVDLSSLNVLGIETLTKFQFGVQIDAPVGVVGIAKAALGLQLGFQSVTGLGDSVDVREVLEGGYPGRHKFPRKSTNGAIELSRGMTFDRSFWNWFNAVRSWEKGDPDYRKTISIFLLDHISKHVGGIVGTVKTDYEVWRFDIFDAWPSSWSGPDLGATTEEIAFESITIQHSGFTEAKGLLSGGGASLVSALTG